MTTHELDEFTSYCALKLANVQRPHSKSTLNIHKIGDTLDPRTKSVFASSATTTPAKHECDRHTIPPRTEFHAWYEVKLRTTRETKSVAETCAVRFRALPNRPSLWSHNTVAGVLFTVVFVIANALKQLMLQDKLSDKDNGEQQSCDGQARYTISLCCATQHLPYTQTGSINFILRIETCQCTMGIFKVYFEVK